MVPAIADTETVATAECDTDAMERFPCPCCGHRTLNEPPGSFEICAVCFWEDDQIQPRWLDRSGGANLVCLIEAQKRFVAYGAVETRFEGRVRAPSSTESVEEG